MEKKFLNNIWQYIFSALLGLSLYFLLFLSLEYYLTEIQISVSRVHPLIHTGVLFLFLLIANLFNLKKIINRKEKTIIAILFFLTSFVYYGYYLQIKRSREYLPKIIHVHPVRFIQGEIIEINGSNFGPIFDKGKVFVNETEFITQDWSNNKIIIEAPVPDKFGHFYLYVKTNNGKVSNYIPVETYNPDDLKIKI